jgi:electron transport complex protein RnfD
LSDLFHVSAAPHIRESVTTRNIMRDVVIALIPASLFGVYNFGLQALLIIAISILSCVLTEYLYCKFMKISRKQGDYSDVVTGLLLALNLSVNVPWWIPAMGGIFAILVVKMLFGGIGQNFMNPALAARIFLLISFPVRMTDYVVEKISSDAGIFTQLTGGAIALDGVSGATPLAAIRAGETVDIVKMFLGNIGGTIGETSALAILLGAAYLVLRKVISLRIPVSYLVSFMIFILCFGGKGLDLNFILGQLLGGGLLLGAFFMATDYVTSPITKRGQIVFGVCLGLLTGLFRLLGGSAEGVSFAIVFCNMLVPLIEKATLPRPFGKERVSREK